MFCTHLAFKSIDSRSTVGIFDGAEGACLPCGLMGWKPMKISSTWLSCQAKTEEKILTPLATDSPSQMLPSRQYDDVDRKFGGPLAEVSW